MVFQGLDRRRAERVWQPFLDWVKGSAQDFSIEQPLATVDVPARRFWDAASLKENAPGFVVADNRPNAPPPGDRKGHGRAAPSGT